MRRKRENSYVSSCRTKTYDLHIELLSMLIILLSPVVYPRDHTKDANEFQVHNPFLHMLMSNATCHGKKSYWGPSIIERLLNHFINPLASPVEMKNALTVMTTYNNIHNMSLIKISENVEACEETDEFSYLTLQGLGSIACK